MTSRNKLSYDVERIRRGITQHSHMDLMHDAIRLSIISHAEMVSQLLRNFFARSATDDVMRKYLATLSSASNPSDAVLSNEAQ